MTKERYKELESDQDSRCTTDEVLRGWHFCNDWDGLLIGPEMEGEWDCCTCYSPQEQKEISEQGKITSRDF